MTAPHMAVMAAVFAGMAALSLQEPGLLWVGGAGAALCAVAEVARPWLTRVSTWLWAGVTGLAVVSIAAGLLAGWSAEIGLGGLLAYLQVHRRITARGPSDDRISLLLAALMLISAGGADLGPSFLALAAVWGGALPIALRGTAGRWRGNLGLVFLVLVVGAGLFVIAPRPAATLLGSGTRQGTVGFAPEVRLGAMDSLLLDAGVVFRAKMTPAGPPGRMYWRGIALDAFDGQSWRATLPADGRVRMQSPQRFDTDVVTIEVIREYGADGVLFVPGALVTVDAEGLDISQDPQGGWHTSRTEGRLRYSMVTRPPYGVGSAALPADSVDADVVQRALRLPASLLAEMEPWATSLAGDGPPEAQVEALATYLRDTYTYTREAPNGASEAPLRDFLFVRRAGHCEYFSSALAVLARSIGVPARVVNGFVTDEPPQNGWLTVRRYHAHSWVEVHLPSRGWVIADATPGPGAPSAPGGWQRAQESVERWFVSWLLSYDGADQVRALQTLGTQLADRLRTAVAGEFDRRVVVRMAAVVGIGLGFGVLLVSVYRAVRRRVVGEIAVSPLGRAHAQARDLLARQGVRPPSSLPPVAAAQWVGEAFPGPAADALRELAWLYYDTTLGRGEVGPALMRSRELLRVIRQHRLKTLRGST